MRKLALLAAGALAATVVVVLLSSGTAVSQGPAGDHYACYLAADVAPGGPQNPPPVQIQDQFQNGTFDPGPADRLCAPAQKDQEPTVDLQTHLKRYPITGPPFTPKTVIVTNQFGQFRIRVTGPRFLMVPTSKSLQGPPPPPPQPSAPGFEHYKCYTFNKQPNIHDQFQNRVITVISWTLCNPASKNGSPIKDPTRHLLCYQINGPAPNLTGPVFVNNQFGPEQLRLGIKRQFCVPSTKEVVPG